MSSASISELADSIKANANILEEFLKTNNLPAPSFDVNGPASIPIPTNELKVLEARGAIVSAAQELRNLVLGPTAVLMSIDAHDVLCLQAIYRYRIALSFGVDEQPDFETVSERCNLNVIDLRRILRFSMTNQIFCEPRPNIVAHTAASRLLAENMLVREFVGAVVDEKFPASAHAVDALIKYGLSQEPNQSGFSIGHNTDRGLYDELRLHPARGQRWANAMRAMAVQIDTDFILRSFPWTSYIDATAVDVGGGHGDVSISIAPHVPGVKFIVEDLADVIEGAKPPPHLSDRLSFRAYNFMEEQSVKGADIYYFRNIFHNWPDQICITILRNQIPAMKKGTRLVIDDSTLHDPLTLPPFEERRRRWMDINMLAYFGSRERTISEWAELLKKADPRFKLEKTERAPGEASTILDVIWTG